MSLLTSLACCSFLGTAIYSLNICIWTSLKPEQLFFLSEMIWGKSRSTGCIQVLPQKSIKVYKGCPSQDTFKLLWVWIYLAYCISVTLSDSRSTPCVISYFRSYQSTHVVLLHHFVWSEQTKEIWPDILTCCMVCVWHLWKSCFSHCDYCPTVIIVPLAICCRILWNEVLTVS